MAAKVVACAGPSTLMLRSNASLRASRPRSNVSPQAIPIPGARSSLPGRSPPSQSHRITLLRRHDGAGNGRSAQNLSQIREPRLAIRPCLAHAPIEQHECRVGLTANRQSPLIEVVLGLGIDPAKNNVRVGLAVHVRDSPIVADDGHIATCFSHPEASGSPAACRERHADAAAMMSARWLRLRYVFPDRLSAIVVDNPSNDFHNCGVGDGAVVVREMRANEVNAALGTGYSVTIRVEDADAHYHRAREHGARISQEPVTHLYGERQYKRG